MSEPTQQHSQDRPWHDRPLWQIRACRELFWLLFLIFTVWLAYQARAILIPIILAFALAYVVHPVIESAQRRWNVPRLVSAGVLFVLVLVGVVSFAAWLLPQLIEQLIQLVERAPAYYRIISERYNLPALAQQQLALATDTTTQPADAQAAVKSLLSATGRVFGFIGDVISVTTYLVAAAILILVLFFYFSTRLDRVANIKRYLPASRREEVWKQLCNVDKAFSGYIRGQFVVALFTTTGFCIGFWLTDVPYWFVVSLVGGALSLIPYGQVAGPASAIILKYLETQADPAITFTWLGVLVAPLIVYAITQSMESWVITPLVQGEATNLHPLTVLIVLIIGGSIGGILGLILAIPVTASARMLFDEVIQPRLKEWVETH